MKDASTALRRVLIAAVPLVLLAGCATQQETASQTELDTLRADVEQLRGEVRAAQESAAAASARADQAARAAEAAAADARAASEKADRIYRQSLRK